MNVHIWRVDDTTPTEDYPWVVSCEGVYDPEAFLTWSDAVEYVRTRRLSDAEFNAQPHVDDCNCLVGFDDPRCVTCRADIQGS